jgi:AbrB family looped-hinge helix DNA binding protein
MESACDNRFNGVPMSQTTKLSVRGEITIPKAIRTARRWKPGTVFVVQETSEGVLVRPKPVRKPKERSATWDDLIGIAKYRGPRRSIREMDESVMEEASKHA